MRSLADAAGRSSRSVLAAIVTLLAGVVIGEVGFLRFARQVASDNNDLMLEIASRQASGPEITAGAPVALSMFSAITFAIATPRGWFASYLVLTGFVRSIAAAAGERRADPIVALGAWLIARRRARRAAMRETAAHDALAGPEVADRVVAPGRVGMEGADFVIVASRPKPEWTPGTVLDCGDRWLSVGRAEQRSLAVGLRTLYPLSQLPEAAIMRRVLRYQMPRRAE
jgi:hypothetical protein